MNYLNNLTPRHAASVLMAGLVVLATLHAQAQPASSRSADSYVVQPGDTLWGIAIRQNPAAAGDWRTLQQRNGVDVPELLQPGKVLTLSQIAEARRKKPVAPTKATGTASVVELTGVAWITRGTEAQQPLAAGMVVQANDVLVTDRGTFLSLGLADGSRVVMPSSSAVRVLAADGLSTRLELLGGRLESHVEKQNGRRFEILTRTAGLGVRGTHFRASDENGVTVAEVIEGGVQVIQTRGKRQSVLLQAGQGTLLSATASLMPEPLLSPPQWAANLEGTAVLVSPVAGATGYRLQIARDERFLQLVMEERNEAPAFPLPTGLEAAFYYARVTAFSAHQIEGLPGERVIYLGSNSEPRSVSSMQMADGRVDIRWPAQLGRHHRFELSRAKNFDPVLASETPVFDGVTVGPFNVTGTYYWRSRAIEAAGTAESAVFQGSFDIPAR